jgi:thioredoxin-like negative regulator of GroEL
MENAREFWRLRKVTVADRDPATAQLYDSAHAVLQQGRVEDAIRLLDQVRESSSIGLYHVRASVDIAALLSQAGQLEQAFQLIQALEKELEGEGLDLYFELAYRMGDWERASRSGQRAYQQRPSYAKAFTLALVHAAQKEGPQTMGWLWRAQQDGMPQLLASLDRGEFDFLREDVRFEKLKKVLGGDSTS